MVSTPKKSHLAPNDPYRNMEGPNIRPSNIAKSKLSAAEQNATQTNTSNLQKSKTAKNLEHSSATPVVPTFKNSVTGRKKQKHNSASNSKHPLSFLLNTGPIIFILLLLLGGGAIFFSGQSLLAPHLSSLYTQATDVQFTSYSLRNQRLFSYMLDGGNQIKQTIFTKKFTTFTPYMKSRLNANGIEVGKIDADGNFTTKDLLAGESRVLRYNGEIITAKDFQTKYANDANFREAYYKAKRGRVAGFFDEASDFFYRKFGITRNIFNDYRVTGNNANDTEAFRDTVSERVRGTEANINTAYRETDEDNTTKTVENGSDVNSSTIEGDTAEAKARALATNIASKISASGDIACAALRVANLLSVTVMVNQIFQATNYFLGLSENISKMMAGEGDTSAINATLNFLNTPTTNEVQYVDEDGIHTETVTGTPLESSGAQLVLGGIIPTQYEMNAYSINNIANTATQAVIIYGGKNVVCSGAQAASAIISLAASSVPGGTLAKFIVGMLTETIGGIAITGAVAAVINAVIPTIAKSLYTDLFEAQTGIPAGELYTLGAATANFSLAQNASAYMPASEEALEAQNQETSLVIAQEAEIDRLNRSPFDATSPNTFLGSIFSSLLPIISSTSTIGGFSSILSVANNSINQIMPSASALDKNTTSYTSYYQECENLPGTVCDAYNYNIPVTDLSTINIAPDDPTYESVIMNNLEDDGSTIKPDSELAKFITFCANRESPWGVTDANILSALQTDFGIILNNLPFLNNVVDLINATEDTANLAWATGENCINSSENPRWDNEFKYYQRYIEDIRILDGMGAYEDETNPVLAYQENYYENHPIDTSYEGTLARLTGATKDDIAFMLEFVDYYNFLANYDPSTRDTFAFNVIDHSDQSSIQTLIAEFSQPDTTPSPVIIYSSTIYNDTRNRSFAA